MHHPVRTSRGHRIVDLREAAFGLVRRRRHPWETVRAKFFWRLLAEHDLGGDDSSFLDVGAGDGFIATRFLEWNPRLRLTCLDPGYELGSSEGAPDANLDFVRVAPERTFDAVLLLDVLEHIADDQAMLNELVRRNLKARGHVLISVPAHAELFGRHDEKLGHFRRYDRAGVRRLVHEAGLVVRAEGPLFLSLVPIRRVQQWLEQFDRRAQSVTLSRASSVDAGRDHARPPVSNWRSGKMTTSVVEAALSVDAWFCRRLAQRHSDWTGLSWWALCQTTGS